MRPRAGLGMDGMERMAAAHNPRAGGWTCPLSPISLPTFGHSQPEGHSGHHLPSGGSLAVWLWASHCHSLSPCCSCSPGVCAEVY